MPDDERVNSDLLIRCVRCQRVAEIDGSWEADGETDDEGTMVGVCGGCLTREEEQEIFEEFMRDLPSEEPDLGAT